jgi:hypothetical protein
MTTYRFRKEEGKFAKLISLKGVMFFVVLFVLSVFNALNIPSLFGASFHFFLFEMGLFYLVIVKKMNSYFLTILLFYMIADFMSANPIVSSFVAFLAGLIAVNAFIVLLKRGVGSFAFKPFSFTLLFTFFLIIFSCAKLFLGFMMGSEMLNYGVIIHLMQSVFYSSFICLNLAFVFYNFLK